MSIHHDVKRGDLEAVARQLDEGSAVDARDGRNGYTLLMVAAVSENSGVDVVRLLVERGADVNARPRKTVGGANVLALAVRQGTLEKVEALLDAGADVGYQTETGYDVLINAVHSWAMSEGEAMLSLINLLISRGAPLLGESDWSESALSVASHRGSFDVVERLLAAGADESRLQWDELFSAVALGSAADVEQLIHGADLGARDRWERTAWLLSLQTGDRAKAELLLAAGAQFDEAGNCGQTPLMYAIAGDNAQVLAWLIERGAAVDAKDDFGRTALMMAAEQGATACVRILLEAGARADLTDSVEGAPRDTGAELEAIDPELVADMGDDHADFLAEMDETREGQKAIDFASNIEIVRLLVAAGEDLAAMNSGVRATLLGLEAGGDVRCSREQYEAAKHRRFGTANPEKMDLPFWRAMVRSGFGAYGARAAFDDTEDLGAGAVWSYARYGKSITELPDGRVIEIGGEHEDSYDPDFCIYNEVFVHHPGTENGIEIYGYPRAVFAPTDFHSATLAGAWIFVIGCLGYPADRISGETPVYRLHCETLSMQKVGTSGDNPGWINGHRAVYQSANGSEEIRVWAGKVWAVADGETTYADNANVYVLNLSDGVWRRVEAG